MADKKIPCPSVFMFKEDQETIKELAAESEAASADLFGLWSELDKEVVIHLVTRHVEDEQTKTTPKEVKETRTILVKEFGLHHVGRWVAKQNSTQTREEMAEMMRKDRGLLARLQSTPKYVLLVTTSKSYSGSTDGLCPYLVSKTGISTAAGRTTFLNGENVFRKVEKIQRLTGFVFVKQVSGTMTAEESKETARLASNAAHTMTSNNYSGAAVKQTLSLQQNREVEESLTRAQTDLRVFMYKEDMKMMEELVLQYPNFETGGDLFGLWTSDGKAMIHVVLGPGRHCRRTDVSFNQDIPYLQRNGELLTEHYMLCHIGEWHSHHQLRLSEPSIGDNSTVIRNYPAGAQGFILIIANIVSPDKVTLSPYLYTRLSRSKYDQTGQIIPVSGRNQFKQIHVISNVMEMGKETDLHVKRNNAALHQQFLAYRMIKRHSPQDASVTVRKRNEPSEEPMEIETNHDYNQGYKRGVVTETRKKFESK